jgi:hypothetical protein
MSRKISFPSKSDEKINLSDSILASKANGNSSHRPAMKAKLFIIPEVGKLQRCGVLLLKILFEESKNLKK